MARFIKSLKNLGKALTGQDINSGHLNDVLDEIAGNVTEDGGLASKADLVSGKVPAEQLPSYVNDVINGYLYEGAFYSDSEHTEEIEGEDGKIYVDLVTNNSYRWNGLAYIRVNEVDLSNYYTKGEDDELLGAKQDKLPTIVNDKYLHTNATTGALEWSDAGGGKYLHLCEFTYGFQKYFTFYIDEKDTASTTDFQAYLTSLNISVNKVYPIISGNAGVGAYGGNVFQDLVYYGLYISDSYFYMAGYATLHTFTTDGSTITITHTTKASNNTRDSLTTVFSTFSFITIAL